MAFDFTEFIALARDEGYSLTPTGLSDLFDLFEHLSKGGTILNYNTEHISPLDAQGMLGMAWLDVSRYVHAMAQQQEDS
jgi:hypothetical protein